MKILFLADAVFADLPGGSRVVARELAQGLARRGHAVTFLVARQDADAPDDERRADGTRIVRYGGAGRFNEFVRRGREACARLWEEAPFDVVHTHFAYAALGPLKAIPPDVPHVRSFYGPWHEEGWLEDQTRLKATRRRGAARGQGSRVLSRLKYALRAQVERANLRRSHAALVLSDQSHGEVTALGYPAGKIRKVTGGVDVARFRPAEDRQAVRAELGLPDDRFLLFSVRRLAPRMGLDRLIQAMPAVVARRPDVLLLIGGRGPERERLAGLIETLGLADHVRLLGFIPDDRLAAHYQAADLFVLPTLALEGFGLVTTEALACGVPVLGTNVGATPEILSALDPRLVIPGTSPEVLSRAILGFLEGGWAKDLTPDRMRRFALDRYQWDYHVEAVENLYREVIGQGAIGRGVMEPEITGREALAGRRGAE